MQRGWSIALVACLSACSAAPTGLTVDVRTDLAPAIEFASVQTEVMAPAFTSPAATGMVSNSTVVAHADFVRGQRVAELPTLGTGDWYVRVSLLDATGRPLLRRTTALTLSTRYSLTVVLARACGGVVCPSTGDDPRATECNGGHCVRPGCSPENPSACTSGCTHDAECARGACGAGTCVAGACLVSRNDAACTGGTCGPDFTCGGAPDAGRMPDAGPPRDAGSCTAHESACTNGADDDCDGHADCADPDCDHQSCDDGNACTHHDQCVASASACMGTAISCVNEPCRTHTCNGTAACTDGNVADGTGCGDDGNPCTLDACSGGACVHPIFIGDNGQYDGDYNHRCCGGGPTQLGTDANCDACGDQCGGQGCGGYSPFGWNTCNCPVSNQFCADRGRGTCYDGAGDGAGWLCQCQNDGDCAGGQTCCHYGGPAFRHVCRWGAC